MDNNNKLEKGVSLIIVFFVMLILIAIIVSASTLLFSEIKIVKNMGSSVISFYAADSGIEKVLYYDRREVPDGAVRGICNICDLSNSEEWDNCTATGASCTDCTDCHIDFTTSMTSIMGQEKFFNITADVSEVEQTPCPLAVGSVNSFGTYINIKRAINLNITKEVKTGFGSSISDDGTWVTGNQVIHFRVNAPPYPGLPELWAYVSYSATEGGPYTFYDDPGNNPVSLDYNSGQNDWRGNYNTNTTGYFSIGVGFIDADGYCISVTITP